MTRMMALIIMNVFNITVLNTKYIVYKVQFSKRKIFSLFRKLKRNINH